MKFLTVGQEKYPVGYWCGVMRAGVVVGEDPRSGEISVVGAECDGDTTFVFVQSEDCRRVCGQEMLKFVLKLVF